MSLLPLRLRLVAVVVVLSALGLALSGLAASTALHGYLLGRVDAQLSSTLSRLDDSPPLHHDGEGQPDPLTDVYAQLRTGSTVVATPLRDGLSAPALPADVGARRQPFDVGSVAGPEQWRAQVATTGNSLVVVAVPLDGVDATLARLRLLELAGGGLVLVLLAGVGYAVVRRSLRPLVAVEDAAQRIAEGDLSLRVPEGSPRTEVGSLSRSFNGMVERLETSFAAQGESEAQARASEERMRRFVGDASHELRTPLTTVRGFAELYRQGALPSAEAVDHAMSRVESEARRMGGLVDDLLLLARLDQQRPLTREPVDLGALARDAVDDARAVAPGRDITLRLPDQPCSLPGDPARLAQVVRNLLTNALVHAGPAAHLRVGLDVVGAAAVLTVADDGPGVREQDKVRVFERFYRPDSSRERGSGGSGLGLSIVQGLVVAHSGTVAVTDTPGGGATFVVRLPLSPAVDVPELVTA